MSNIIGLKSAETFASEGGNGLFRVQLLDIETPNSSTRDYCIAHLSIAADVGIIDPRGELESYNTGIFVDYAPAFRQKLATSSGEQNVREASAEAKIIFLDRYCPEKVRNGRRHIAAMLVANNFTVANLEESDYELPENPSPYDFIIAIVPAAVGKDDEAVTVHLGID